MIFNVPNICPREEPQDIDYFKFKEALERLREEINTRDVWRVVNGKAPKELIKAFNEGETIGKESRKKLDLEILDKFEKEVLE
jgi:hypothetical protein